MRRPGFRLALLLALMMTPAPVSAQTGPGILPGEYATHLELERQRAIALENELNAREAARRAEEAVRTLQAQSRAAPLTFDVTPAIRSTPAPASMAVIPDDWLAASNARVKAAAENRR